MSELSKNKFNKRFLKDGISKYVEWFLSYIFTHECIWIQNSYITLLDIFGTSTLRLFSEWNNKHIMNIPTYIQILKSKAKCSF